MKTVDNVLIIWVVEIILLTHHTVEGFHYLDYVETVPEDPLKPIWDRLTYLPLEIFTGFQTQMDRYQLETHKAVEGLSQQISALEAKLDHAINNFRSPIGEEFQKDLSDVKKELKDLSGSIASGSDTLASITTHVTNISHTVSGAGDVTNCSLLLDKVTEVMNDQRPVNEPQTENGTHETSCGLDAQAVSEMNAAVERLRQTTLFLPRDCSDIHWQSPETPSGVFQTYPNMDPKGPVEVWCDMGPGDAHNTGGWTVILQRRNTTWGLENFNRAWAEYRKGFGTPGEGEWWYGLASLHALTYRQPYEALFLLHDIQKGHFQANYTTFRVEDESKNFRLVVSGFSGNVSDAFESRHHGKPFSTYDADHDDLGDGSCAANNGGGWWYARCHRTVLTAIFPTSNDRSARTIRWSNGNEWLVLDDVTIKIRPSGYASRFDHH